MRVLIVKTSSMGDILHTLPALTDAKRAIPNIQFDWVVEENFAEIPTWHPAVKRVIPIALRRWRKTWFHRQTRKERRRFMAKLMSRRYDCIIDAQGLFKSAFFVVRHTKGVKHGYDFRSAREPLASLFYDKKHFVDKHLHAVERIRQLFLLSLKYTSYPKIGDYGIAPFFKQRSIEQTAKPYFVFLHSTTRDEKHWPEAHWQKLIKLILDRGFAIKLPWGTDAERERAMRLSAAYDDVEVLPKSTLGELAQVLVNAKAVVSVDTGLSHLAAALSCPNLTLYGPTDPILIGGYGQNQYYYRRSSDLTALSVEHVYKRLCEIGFL